MTRMPLSEGLGRQMRRSRFPSGRRRGVLSLDDDDRLVQAATSKSVML